MKYQAERREGAWHVVDSSGQSVGIYGAGSTGATTAMAAAEALNSQRAVPSTRRANRQSEGTSWLRAWRTEHHLSQGALGDLLGVHWLTVQRWEAGQRAVPPFLKLALERLEQTLEVPA